MKKGWKIFWIVCACLAGVGILLCIGGFAMGASFAGVEQAVWGFENRVEKHTEQLEDREDRLDDAYDNDDFDDVEATRFSGNRDVITNGMTVAAADIRELDVDVCWLMVEIQETEGNDIVFLTDNIPAEAAEQLILTQEGAELEVQLQHEKEWNQMMKNLGELALLTIQIPKEHQIQTMTLSIGEGVLGADNIQTDELNIEVGAGNAEITQFTARVLDVEVDAGEANIAGHADMEANIECGIGKVNYQAAGSKEDYSYDIEVGAGRVLIDNEEYSGISKGKKSSHGGKMMEIECGIGEVIVGFMGA